MIKSIQVGETGSYWHVGLAWYPFLEEIKEEWLDTGIGKILVYVGYNAKKEKIFQIEANNSLTIIYDSMG